MTTMAPAGEGGGGTTGTTTTTATTGGNGGGGGSSTSSAEQAPNTAASPATPQHQQQQQQQLHPPPSPLSGCYLLVVLPEPHTAQHKDLILNRLAKGFLSWDKDSCHVDLEKELQALVAQAPEGEEARNGERLIQYATENLVTEVLIYPQSNTLLQCIRNLLASFTKHRHIIHAGYTFGGNGSWILQDGTFSLADFLVAFSEHEVQRVLRAYENSVTVDIHCAGVGDWSTSRLSKESCTRACRVRVNPDDVLTAGVPAITSFTNYIGQYLIAQTLDQLMEPSDVVGNIRFSHPTLYVFPGGQGDAALFGINGFNMLVDGGFARKACFWDFTRHLDRLDAVLVTRINNSNVGGMSSVLRKKKEMHVYPQIGHFFCNLVERRHSNSPDGDKDVDPLILNLIDIGQEMMVNLRHINLRPHPCYRDPEPINLYHKVGHGTLNMYVLSPNKDSREVREFLSKWNASDAKLFASSHRKDSNSIIFPVQNLVSICALLVWQPANPEDTITRILFPGSTPQHKIFEGFERLKHLEFLKHPVCTAKSISPSQSLATLKDKTAILKPKLGSIERETKRLAEVRREKRDVSEIKTVKKDSVVDDTAAKISTGKPIAPIQPKTETKARKVVENKKIESEAKESKIIDKELKDLKKEVKKVEKSERSESETKKTDGLKVETEKTAPIKEPKVQKIDTKKKESKEITKSIVKTAKPESTTKPSIKSIEKKIKSSGEKKDIMKSSPTTPKKSMNGAATKTEISKTVTKSTVKTTSKLSSAAAPAKSAKDANNRMVVEQKNNELSSIASSAGQAKVPAKPKAIERKPISRRTKPISPSKARLPISPAKSTRSTPTASVKSEKDAVIRKVKGGTTDSSAVSTPSGIEPESAIKLIDKNLTEKSEDMSLDSIESKVLADLKEEREVVEEIEAVLQKAERIEEARKEERFDGDDEITAEATDKKEEDMTEEDVTAEMDDVPKKISRKESQEFTEEDEYLIVEKEEIYTEDSMQSGDTEQKHHLDEAESEKTQVRVVREPQEEEDDQDQEEDKDFAEEKKDEIPEKKLVEASEEKDTRKSVDLSFGDKELLKEEMKQIIASATEAVQKTEDKDDSGKRDSEDITKEPSSLSPDKLDSSAKPDVDQKEVVPEKLEESQERISTLESGATTTAPTLPEDERIPLDEIKEDVDEKHVVEDVKEKDVPIKQKEVVPETLPIVTKPEVKVLDVRPPTHHGIARDVVKTPDEVADLPVHEEVDPKLYRMDDLEKDKDTKVPLSLQEVKETPAPSTAPPPKEKDKGVFSFFGKVADKFEKGIDKLTKKTRRDSSDKDAEDKSSKSSSPKEPKPQQKALLEEVDIDKVFPKVGKLEEKPDIFEQAMPQVSDIKVAAIKETASFLQEEIKDTKIKGSEEFDILQSSLKSEDEKLKEQVVEDIEEVEAFVEEASKKFRNVKDSLQDSLESLDDKVDEAAKLAKDTLTGVAEKLGDFDSKEPEKVKFIIPSTEEDLEGEEDDSEGVVRDFKEAVRDVAEVLVGTAGIEIEKEEKPKDVVEIVKKVAEVLKEDDFLSEKVLLSDETKAKDEDKGAKSSPEEAMIPKKVGVTEEFAPQEEVQELLYGGETKTTPIEYEKADGFEIREEPCTKVIKEKDISASSPVRDEKSDIQEAMRLCEDLMKDDIIEQPARTKREIDTQQDVMDLGLEGVCIKTVTKRVFGDDKEEEEKVVEPEISFEQKLSPGKAELVTVTPGSTPTSPKLATELGLPELSAEYRDIFNKDTSLESIIEEFIVLKKHKITMQVLEYISIVKCVPKEKVINIIQEIIIKYKIPRESIADNVQILRIRDDISPEQRLEVETYITNEYLNKNKKISLTVIEEISTARKISKRIVIEIIEEIIIKRHASRESVFDITEESYFMILKDDLEKVSETDKTKKDLLVDISDAAGHEITHSPIKEVEETCAESSGIEVDKIVDGFVSISSKDAVEAFLQQERKKSHEESKIVDDFEAVEQEYKVRGVPSLSTTEKLSELKDKETEEVDDVSDVIEADEKFVKETVEKSIKEEHIVDSDLKKKDNKKVEQEQVHDYEISEVSEVDTKEKYLDEAKEKTSSAKETVTSEISDLIKDSQEKIIPGKADTDATGRSDITKIEDLHIDKKDDQDNLIDDLASKDIGQESLDSTVRRMVVTASSEDGGHETEICASGTITFIKTPTPEDSLNITDIKTTSEKDSLILEKDSLRSIGSTPEKDSLMSDKSDHAGKEITPEDSLEKSPTVGTEPLKSDIIKVDDIKLQELDSKIKETEKLEETLKHSVLPLSDMAKTPDSVHSGDASPAESVFAKSPTEQAFSHQPESLLLDKDLDKLDAHDKEKEKSKSPSVEKDTSVSSDAKAAIDEKGEDKRDDRSKSPSAEKEIIKKEGSPKKSQDDLDSKKAEEDRSKSPSVEKETATGKESRAGSIVADRSKSPSIEKEKDTKELSPEKTVVTEDVIHAVADSTVDASRDQSKSPSVEKELSKKEESPEKTLLVENVDAIQDRSKSPSVEKDVSKKEPTPEKVLASEDLSQAVHDTIADAVRDKSKSPSVEKETDKKEPSPEKVILSEDIKHEVEEKVTETPDDKSKSPSVEKGSSTEEPSPEKVLLPEDIKSALDDKVEDELHDRSKSPSVEKETGKKEPSPEKSKSPSAERESDKKEPSPEKDLLSEDLHDHSKSPSVEKETEKKEPSPEKAVTSEDLKHVDEKIIDTAHDKSKSPSVEKEIKEKELSPVDRSKSPSVEKETEKKEPSSEKAVTSEDLKHVDEKVVDAVHDKSKSPSVEKEIKEKEPSPVDRSKSPSVEKETEKKEPSPEKAVTSEDLKHVDAAHDKSKSPSVEKEIKEQEPLPVDRSKSPSVEKEVDKKEPSPEKAVTSADLKHALDEKEIDVLHDKSKSPSVEKEIERKESSPVDRSKSPSVEKETVKKEPSPVQAVTSEDVKHALDEKETDVLHDKSKSPGVEKESESKEPSPEKSFIAEDVQHKIDAKIDDSSIDRSKSPSVEKETSRKESLATIDAKLTEESHGGSKSPSPEKDADKKEPSPEKTLAHDDMKHDLDDKVTEVSHDKSKSPSVEKETSRKESLATIDAKLTEESHGESKSPSPEKDADRKEPSPEKTLTHDDMKHDLDDKVSEVSHDKSKSPSVEKEIEKKEPSPEKSLVSEDIKHVVDEKVTGAADIKSKSLSVEKEIAKKEPSPEKTHVIEDLIEAVDEVMIDTLQDKSKSPSVEKETGKKEASPDKAVTSDDIKQSAEKKDTQAPHDKSKSPSVEKEMEKKEPSLEESLISEDIGHVDEKVTGASNIRSKSPSVEKETTKKEPSPEKAHMFDDLIHALDDTADEKHDKSKSPSVEKETDKKEPSPEKVILSEDMKHEVDEKVTGTPQDRSKSPSIEKELAKKEPSPEKLEAASHDASKSPSVEKETSHVNHARDDRSKSPSAERDTDQKEPSTEKVSSEDINAQDDKIDKLHDKSKSPSVEKETDKKEPSPEKSLISEDIKHKIDADSLVDKSKSPSPEKDVSVKEPSPEKALASEDVIQAVHTTTVDASHDRSKSPSVEKETDKKEPSPEKVITLDEIKHEAEDKAAKDSHDKSKSPSVEKDLGKKEPSLEKSLLSDDLKSAVDEKVAEEHDRSKSPNVEKETDKKESSPEKDHETKDAQDRSKSPSVEKESEKKESSIDRSKSPSVEKDTSKKETSPEKEITSGGVKHDVDEKLIENVHDKSKSPSLEKEISQKEPSPEKEVSHEKSKSPSVEKETDKKEPSPEKALVSEDIKLVDESTVDVSHDRSKSPSVEKEASKKESSPEKSDTSEGIVADVTRDKSKSPSAEKELEKKEPSPEKSLVSEDIKHTVDAKVTDVLDVRSKSPSVEKEPTKKEPAPERSHVIEDLIHAVDDVIIGVSQDRSKSPSVDKETSKKEASPEKIVTAEGAKHEVDEKIADIHDKSKSPSVEKEIEKKESSPEKSLIAEGIKSVVDEVTEGLDRSKSPSVEKETSKKEASPEKSIVSEVSKKDEDAAVVKAASEGSKSPSVEKETTQSASDKAITESTTDRSKSPSVEESDKKEPSPDKSSASEDLKHSKDGVVSESLADKSKSPSMEREIVKKEMSPEKSIIPEHTADEKSAVTTDAKSKSPSVEKDTALKSGVDSRSGSVSSERGIDYLASQTVLDTVGLQKSLIDIEDDFIQKDDKLLDKLVSSSISEKVGGADKSASTGDREKSASPHSDKSDVKSEIDGSHRTKSPSLEKEILSSTIPHSEQKDESSSIEKIDDSLQSRLSITSDKIEGYSIDKTESSSIVKDKQDILDKPQSPSDKDQKHPSEDLVEKSLSKSRSSSISESKHQIEDKLEKSRSPSLAGSQTTERHDFDKSKSVSPVSERSRADVSLHESSDVRKASITSVGSHVEDKGKDRSRSHSLFETGDKTPLVRSRAASLYEDKLVEKLGILDNVKDSLGHTDDIFEEQDELRLSHETLDELQKDVFKRDTEAEDYASPDTKEVITDYLLHEYINKKIIITLYDISEISNFYKVDRHIIMKIIDEIIDNLKVRRDTIIVLDEQEYADAADAAQKVLDDEENLIHYITDEFVAKKKKINSKMVDEIASTKSVSRQLVVVVIENIITSRSLRRESIVDADFSDSEESFQKEPEVDLKSTGTSRKESFSEKLSDTPQHLKDISIPAKSISPSPEPDSLITSKSDRPEPHIDEEITISENKRIEIETLLMDNYVIRGIKITENILEQISLKTSLPKYIIIEIIEEILIKKHLSRDAIADKAIFHDDDFDDAQMKLDYERESLTGSAEHKPSGYSTPDTQQYEDRLEKSMPYTDYESPFHKAFMGGMTEIRTTHITTLSGKSTPDFGLREGTPDSSSEITNTTTTTIPRVPETFDKTSDHKPEVASQVQAGKSAEDTVVVLKTTQITTYPETRAEITKEVTKQETVSGSTSSKIATEEEIDNITKVMRSAVMSILDDAMGHESSEVITTTTTKTITSETEIDPISLLGSFEIDDLPQTSTHLEKTTTITSTSATDSKITAGPASIDEKLISLDTHDKSPTDIKSKDHTQMSFMGKDLMDHTAPEQLEQSVFPLIKDLITDERSYSGKSSPDVSLPKDLAYGGSTGKSTPDISMSPLIRDSNIMQSHLSGRSTPDKRSDNRSRTATPEGFRSGDVIRTIITTTRTMSDDGDIITTTREVTEATNDKGETVVITEKTDVKVDDRLPETYMSETKPIDIQRTTSPGSDIADRDMDPTSPRSDLSSGHSRAATHMWGSSEERHTYSDEEQSSPQFSPSPHHPDPRLPATKETSKTADDFSSAAMSSSFYGELPDEPVHFSSTITKTTESLPESDEYSFKKFMVEKEYAGGYTDTKGSKKYIDEADLDFEKALTGFKDDKGEHEGSQESSSSVLRASTQELSGTSPSKSTDADGKKDPLAGWGSPLGLPSPKAPRKFNLRSPIQPTSSADLSPDSLNFDVINDWGEPMRLPSPAPATNEVSNKGSPGTPKKERKQAKKVISENIKNKKRSESPSKNDKRTKDSKNKVQPVYVDLTYVSHHGNSFYTALEFFKKVRARYYVFSGTEPSREVYDALLEAKKTWEDKDLEVTMIPTYDTDTLGYWVADNEEALAAHHIDLSPSASRCTINLQDHETSCSAYRLEF